MFEEPHKTERLLYFTTPFCGVCQSAQPIIEMLAMSLELAVSVHDVQTFTNTYAGLHIVATPSLALVRGQKLVYYTEQINNLTDLFQRFERALEQE